MKRTLFYLKRSQPNFTTASAPKKRDMIKIISIFISAVLTFSLLFLPKAAAKGEWDATKNMAKDIISGAGASEILKTVGIGGSSKDERGMFTDVYEYLTGTTIRSDGVSTNTGAGTLTADMAKFENAVKYFAMFWVVVIATSRIIKSLTDGRDATEVLLSMLVEICITGLIILYSDKFVPALCAIMTEIVRSTALFEVNSSLTNGSGASHTWRALLEDMNGACPDDWLKSAVWNIGCIAGLTFPWICNRILWLANLFVLIQILIEMGIRRVFVPLALTDVFGEGLRSSGVRYIKKLLASILKLGICIIISRLSAVFVSMVDGPIAFIIILVGLVSIGAMFKAGEYANDVLGV